MTIPYDWLALLGVLTAYIGAVWLLHRSGHIGPDKPLSLFGPALMLKTERGRATLDRIAARSPRLWNGFADAGVVLALAAMVGMVLLLLWEATKALSIPSSAAPSPSAALALPGINPFIPVGYGILALVVGVAMHELCHGILARANGVKVKSLGVLWLVIPIGAFVEQDEEDLKAAPARSRNRIVAAGVMANFVLALLFLLLLSALFASTIHPKAEGVGVYAVVPGSPAQNLSLAPGDIVTSLNGTRTPDPQALAEALSKTYPGQRVMVEWYSQGKGGNTNSEVVLASRSAFVHNLTSNASRLAFLGISEYPMPPQVLSSLLQNPFGGSAAQSGLTSSPFSGPLLFLALPFIGGLEPIQGTPSEFFSVSGPLSALTPAGVIFLANVAYWLTWMNLLLGLTNALPAVPLDGGLLFRDAATKLFQPLRASWPEAKLEKAVNRFSLAVTLIVFLLILWQFVAPRL